MVSWRSWELGVVAERGGVRLWFTQTNLVGVRNATALQASLGSADSERCVHWL